MRVIKFSRDYSKLYAHIFPTIRRYDHYPYGEYQVVVKKKDGLEIFFAKLILKVKVELKNIPTEFLVYDTDTNTREEAVNLLNSFYKKPISEDEELTILLFKRKTLWDVLKERYERQKKKAD